METIISMISNVGFPIAACVILFIQNGKFTNALAENTQVLNMLVNEIEKLERGKNNDD